MIGTIFEDAADVAGVVVAASATTASLTAASALRTLVDAVDIATTDKLISKSLEFDRKLCLIDTGFSPEVSWLICGVLERMISIDLPLSLLDSNVLGLLKKPLTDAKAKRRQAASSRESLPILIIITVLQF